MATALLAGGLVIATASSAQADQTFTPTCTMYVDAAPILTFAPALTLGVDAPDAAPPGAVITVTVNAHPEDLPTSDANPQLLVAYQNLSTVYAVDGGTVVPGSEHITSGATIKTFPLTTGVHIVETPTSVAPVVDGPIPPGAFVPPAFTFQVVVDPAAAAVTFTATEHEETADFDGPGPAESGASTCPINGQLASTTVDPNATTTTAASPTTTTSTSTSTSTMPTTTTSIGGTTTTTVGGTTTSTVGATTTTTLGGTTTTTLGTPPPPPFSIGDPTVVEPKLRQQAHLSFTVLRSDASRRDKVHFRTIDGTAKHRVDFDQRDFGAEFPRGKLAITITVTVKHNPDFTEGRWFLVEISDPRSGAVFGTAIATITES